MSTIGPGSILICIDNDGWPQLKVGGHYECAGVENADYPCDTCGAWACLNLKGFGREVGAYNGELVSWWPCPHHFIPAGHRGMFDSLLKCEPTKDEVPAEWARAYDEAYPR